MPCFQRLMGLETEYVLRIPEEIARAERGIHSHREGYEAMVGALRERISVADADPFHGGKVGLFLGTSGALWFESLRPPNNLGLIEGATPECRDPFDLLACQRAQDQLLAEAAGEFNLASVKNCRDAKGHAYGAQENYEVVFAKGLALWVWRILAAVVLIPLVIVTSVAVMPCLLLMVLPLPMTGLAYLAVSPFLRSAVARKHAFDYLIGRVWRCGWNGVDVPAPGCLATPTLWCLKVIVAPIGAAVWLFSQITSLGRMHLELSTFLASRGLVAGAGRLDPRGRFQPAEKAGAINCIAGCAEFIRPMFSLGQPIKPLAVLVRANEVFEARQRVQISLGDSNMCEEAELLRLGTTMLVIDAWEAGALQDAPRLAHPIRAMKAICADPS
jgi:proteasome accessory factor A